MRRKRENGRAGGSLLAVSLLVMTTAALSGALLAIVRSTTKEQRGAQEDLRSLYVTEAAVAEAVYDLSQGGTGDVGSEQAPLAFGPGSAFFVEATDLGNDCTSLVATGRDARTVSRVEVVVQRVPSTAFPWAAFGDETLEMDSNARVDSYDSTLGSYAGQQVNGSGTSAYANSDGDVGSNGNLDLSSNATVWGDARPGPGGTTTTNGSNTYISGSTLPLATTTALEPLVIPVLPSSGNLVVMGTTTIPAGDVRYSNLTLASNSTTTVIGPARIVVGNMELQSGSKLLVDAAAGPVELYVEHDFVMSSNTLITSMSNSPLDFSLLLKSDNIIDPNLEVDLDEIDFNSNAMLFGTIRAPNASIEINSNFELFGGITARRLRLDSNARIHYDEALLGMSAGQVGSYETLCWRVLPVN